MNVRNNLEGLTQVVPAAGETGAAAQAKANATRTPALSQDQASVSSAASRIANSASDADVRLEKVASIQSAIQSGTYQVPASAVAQKLITSLLAPEK